MLLLLLSCLFCYRVFDYWILQMELRWWGFWRHVLALMVIGALWNLKGSEGIRFVIDREECFSHDVKYEGDTVHVSFVVIKAESFWHYGDEGVDLVVCSYSLKTLFYFLCSLLCLFELFFEASKLQSSQCVKKFENLSLNLSQSQSYF